MAGAGAGAGARGGAAAGVEARARDPPPAHRAHPRHPRPAAQPSARRMDGASGGLGSGDNAPTTEALFVALGAGVTALSHPLLYVKLLIQVWSQGRLREAGADVKVTGQGLEKDGGGGGNGGVLRRGAGTAG